MEYRFLDEAEFVAGSRGGCSSSTWSTSRASATGHSLGDGGDRGRRALLRPRARADGALSVQADVAGSVTLFIAAAVEELERRLRERATESTGEIDDRIALARHQLEQAHRFRYMVRNDDVVRATGSLAHRRARARIRRYHGPLMIEPRIDDLLEHVDSRYALVIVAAKRARQINSYHHQLGEGMGFEEAPPPLIESRSKNYLTMAMEEIAQAKIAYAYPQVAACPAHNSSRNRHTTPVARIILGISGGIAAYKACEIIRRLVTRRAMTSSRSRARGCAAARPSRCAPAGSGAGRRHGLLRSAGELSHRNSCRQLSHR